MPRIAGSSQSFFPPISPPSSPNQVIRLGGSFCRSGSATTPQKTVFEYLGRLSDQLFELFKSKPKSTRSIHAVLELQRTRIDAAVQALEKLGEGEDITLACLSLQLQDCRFKDDREATKAELNTLKSLDQDLLNLIASKLRRSGMSSPKDAMQQAKMAFDEACTEVLNRKDWNTVDTRFTFNDKAYACTQVPAAQMKLGIKDIFPTSYNGHGICCTSDRETAHATNLWTSEIRSEESGTVLFKGVRHGILSPHALEKGSVDRTEGAKNRAKEVVAAALFACPELLEKALRGDTVSLKLASTSLVTGGLWNERDMLDDQVSAWQALRSMDPLVLSLSGSDGELHEVKIDLKVAAFNFGVNELALKFGLGQTQADGYNATALSQLLGDDLKVDAKPGGWVGEYLAQDPTPENADRVVALSRQLKEIWAAKAHNRDGGEPYKAAERVAMLAYEIGAVPCWNCKSGKDRTGMLGAELYRAAVEKDQKMALTPPGRPLTEARQTLLQQALLHGGHLEVQEYNTGAPGNKVMKELPPGFNLAYKQRVGSEPAWKQAQGLSGWVKA